MTTPNFTIVFPSRCPLCAHNEVPAEQRTVIVLEHEERCGKCGHSLGSRHTIHSTLRAVQSQLVCSVIRSLVQHGVFEIDSTPGSQNPIRLCREDDQADGLVTCHINYASSSGNSEEPRSINRYDRNKIASALPPCVRSACELLANLRQANTYMSFVGADVKRNRKSIRFSWSVRCDYDNGYRFNYEQVSIEIAWTAKNDGAALIPTPEEAVAKQKHLEGAAAELRIAADVAALRLACTEEINSTSSVKSIPLGGINYLVRPPREYSYHPAAIEQIESELDARGWKTKQLVRGSINAEFYLHLERQ